MIFFHPSGFTLLPPLRGRGVSLPQAPLSDKCIYLKVDITKKWLFCLNKGVFEIALLSGAFLHTLEIHGLNHCEIKYQGGVWVCRLQLLLATENYCCVYIHINLLMS